MKRTINENIVFYVTVNRQAGNRKMTLLDVTCCSPVDLTFRRSLSEFLVLSLLSNECYGHCMVNRHKYLTD